ncbi:hypothetical protein Esi_0003_0342 [Ectocarpus siliculosus]|uniref:Uncharacterized protein n=1 Tax=Ectocarpus siliculosus TaxID=2880 RepID=D7FWA3_ECTSI|nr:hypothetical protein Esi_0003_0342 [Ectocarpus siliculosus]|eukprot:CBJ25623.1 hypothetical protein Esi_0003_0342 [Ectocarpus siliculosus]
MTDAVAPLHQEDEDRMEQTARTSILALAHAAPKRPPSAGNSASPSSATAGFDLRAVFNSLGGAPAGDTAVLRAGDLQAALVRLCQEDSRTSLATTAAVPSAGVSDAAAARVAARVVGTSEGVDYRRFEDWIMPPRGFEEVRRVLIELVEEGSFLGLTAAELFLQLDDGAQHEGIGSRELKKGLASLSVHLTETEVAMVMSGAGSCSTGGGIDERNQSGKDRLIMTLEEFSALVQNPLKQRQRAIPVTATGSAARALEANKSPQGAELSNARRHTNNTDGAAAAEDGDGCVTPDSLAPRMSLSELQVLDDGKGSGGGSAYAGGPATSNSTAAHVEAFGRVAADVQAVLATAVSGSGTGRSGPGTGGQDGCSSGTGGKRGGPGGSISKDRRPTVPSPNSSAGPAAMEACATDSRNRVGVADRSPGEEEGKRKKKKKEQEGKHGGEEQESTSQTPTSSRVSTAASRSAPFPRTGAITPPFGPARSPSEPLHPTRASRERLEAALEGLDLKERLRPTTTVGGNNPDNGSDHPTSSLGARRRSSHRSAGARLPAEGAGGEARQASSQRRASSVGGSGRRPGTSSSVAKVAVGTAASPATFLSRRLASDVVGGGVGSSNRRPVAGRRRTATGVDERGSRADRLSGSRSGAAGPEQRQQQLLGEVVDLTAAEGARKPEYDGGSEGAPEVIGGLRAKVAELELAEHLLRCELDGARSDLVSERRRAEKESRREAARAKERERVLQTRMGARLRAAEAEAAATAKRMADFKRASATEAAAREKSSADYLRRRLKEAEVVLEAKAARRISSSKRQQQQRQRAYLATGRPHRESRGGDDGTDSAGGSGSGDGTAGRGIGSSSGWGQRRARRRIVPPGDAGGGVGGDRGGDRSAAAAAAKLRDELASCRKKLDVATAEVSRLKKEVSAASGRKGGGRRGDCKGAEEWGGGGGPVAKERGGGKKSARPGKACLVCGERGGSSRERQKQRERRLAARMAESEDARIEVEAEAGRLQAFLDEMRGLGPPIVQYWRGGAEREAE